MTTIREWYEPAKFENSQVVVKIALSYKGYYDWLLINLSKFESWWSSKTLNVVSDTDSSRYVKEWWVWKLIEKGTSQTHIF